MRLLPGALLGCLVLMHATAALAGPRVALVIGNSDYRHIGVLGNPARDATAVARALQGLGFTLVGLDGSDSPGPVLDVTEKDDAFFKMLQAFSRRAQGAEIALIYYAGHGMQVSGEAFILPVDVPRDSVDVIKRSAISVEKDVLAPLDGKAGLSVVVFDACREIPHLEERARRSFTRGGVLSRPVYRGLAPTKVRDRARIVAYSGAPGELVADGDGTHGPYTAILLKQLASKPDREIGQFFRHVAFEFGGEHDGQSPELVIGSDVPPDRYYFRPPADEPPGGSSWPTGRLVVTTNQERVSIRIGDRAVGEATPDRPLEIDDVPAGRVTVTAVGPNESWQSREFSLFPGEQERLNFDAVEPVQSWPQRRTKPWQASRMGYAIPQRPAPRTSSSSPAVSEADLQLDAGHRQQVQQVLNRLGFDVGEVDGNWGSKTRAGIERWQRSTGIAATGYLDALSYPLLLSRFVSTQSSARDGSALVGGGLRHALKDGGQGPEMALLPRSDGSWFGGGSGSSGSLSAVDAFAISRREISLQEYARFCDATGRESPLEAQGGAESAPVIRVERADALAYVTWLSEQTGKAYRLPTQQELERVLQRMQRGRQIDSSTPSPRVVCVGCDASRYDAWSATPWGSWWHPYDGSSGNGYSSGGQRSGYGFGNAAGNYGSYPAASPDRGIGNALGNGVGNANGNAAGNYSGISVAAYPPAPGQARRSNGFRVVAQW